MNDLPKIPPHIVVELGSNDGSLVVRLVPADEVSAGSGNAEKCSIPLPSDIPAYVRHLLWSFVNSAGDERNRSTLEVIIPLTVHLGMVLYRNHPDRFGNRIFFKTGD